MGRGLAIFLYYFAPISAGMFVFGLINAIKHVIRGNDEKATFPGVISTIGFLMSLGTLLFVLAG